MLAHVRQRSWSTHRKYTTNPKPHGNQANMAVESLKEQNIM